MRCSPAKVYYIEKMLEAPERVPGFHWIHVDNVGYPEAIGHHSRVSNCLRMSANSGSVSLIIFGEALLNGSSAGMRSSQRCSESFSWPEKYRRTNSFTGPLFSFSASSDLDGDLDFDFAFAGLGFSALARSALATASLVASGCSRSSLYWSFLSRRKVCFQFS